MCSAEMVVGSIVARSPGVKFKVSRGVLGDLTGVRLTSGFFNHTATAFRCESCGTVLVPGDARTSDDHGRSSRMT